MVWLKQGVIGPVLIPVRAAIERVHDVLAARGEDLFILSLREGDHKAGSAHFDGRAFDMRLGSLTADELTALLGKAYRVRALDGEPAGACIESV